MNYKPAGTETWNFLLPTGRTAKFSLLSQAFERLNISFSKHFTSTEKNNRKHIHTCLKNNRDLKIVLMQCIKNVRQGKEGCWENVVKWEQGKPCRWCQLYFEFRRRCYEVFRELSTGETGKRYYYIVVLIPFLQELSHRVIRCEYSTGA